MGDIYVFLCLSLLVSGVKLQHSTQEDTNRRLDLLEKKVAALTNEVTRLKHAKARDCDSGPQQSSDRTEVSSGKMSFPVELKVLEARRETVPTGVMFTVRYWTNGQHPVVKQWTEESDAHYSRPQTEILKELEDDPTHSAGPGIRETRVITGESETNMVTLQLVSFSTVVLMGLRKDEHDQILNEIDQPQVRWTPPGDIVYEPGQDVTVNFEFPRSEDGDGKMVIDKTYFLLDPKIRRDVILSYGKPPFKDFEVPGNTTELLESSETPVTFRTSKYQTRGAVTVACGKLYFGKEKPLLESLYTFWSIPIRASNETGPFPHGLLRATVHGSREKDNGTLKLKCSTESETDTRECYATCLGVGMDVKRVTVSRYISPDRKVVIKSDTITALGSIRSVDFNPSNKDPGRVIYYCEAFDSNGRSSTEMFEVNFYIPTSVVRSESHALWLNDTTVEFKCVVRSMKQPQNITWRYHIGYIDTSFDTDNITASGEYKFSSLVLVNVDVQEFFKRRYSYTKYAFCEVNDPEESAQNMYPMELKNLLVPPKQKVK